MTRPHLLLAAQSACWAFLIYIAAVAYTVTP